MACGIDFRMKNARDDPMHAWERRDPSTRNRQGEISVM